jgi:hypothetical protein
MIRQSGGVLIPNLLGKMHNANLPAVPIRDCKSPMFQARFVPMAAIQHISCNYSGVLPRLFISG